MLVTTQPSLSGSFVLLQNDRIHLRNVALVKLRFTLDIPSRTTSWSLQRTTFRLKPTDLIAAELETKKFLKTDTIIQMNLSKDVYQIETSRSLPDNQ